ncbi:peptide deformylase [Halarsenatibacter silvermanii]|uniref:Peptide deformylase n=1 Tax=Halarsenatibacter silvermanii TaxID=321763 RepID=A0A1G9HC64_9FIRM|nr:peptide deformylase [Halarsenatibacter silvermanii]SDL10304.1 peptide deformylase [Halarsenatibacter silvermanii]
MIFQTGKERRRKQIIREVLQLGDPRLRKRSEPVRDFAGELVEIKRDLQDTLIHLRDRERLGRALAAPQIGYHRRVVFSLAGEQEQILVNPKIVEESEETFSVWDSCFSFDLAFFVKVTRSLRITVEYQDEHGQEKKETFTEDRAELYQHELDHLEGVLATDYLCRQDLEQGNENIVTRQEWEKRYR